MILPAVDWEGSNKQLGHPPVDSPEVEEETRWVGLCHLSPAQLDLEEFIF